MSKILISVVVPVYSGEGYLDNLVGTIDRLRTAMNSTDLSLAECILVDDESVDDSSSVLEGVAERFPWVRVLTLSRNFGQHPATVAGIQHTCGDWVITLDEDLQHDPFCIPTLLERSCEFHQDVAYGVSDSAVHDSLIRDGGSRLIKRLVSLLASNPHVRKFSSFRAIRGDVARAAASSCGHESYFDVVLTWYTARVTAVSLPLKDHRFADEGKSSYSITALIGHAKRLMLTSDTRLMRSGFHLGAGAVAGAVVGMLAVVGSKWLMPSLIPVRGWASTMVVSLALFGVVCFQVSVALKMLSLLTHRAQGRPTYFLVNRTSDQAVVKALRSLGTTNEAAGTRVGEREA